MLPLQRNSLLKHHRLTHVALRLLFLLGVATVVLLAIFGLRYAESGFQAIEDVERYSSAMVEANTLHVRLVDAETGVRGYLLTGDAAYLQPYEETIGEIDRSMDRLSVFMEQWPSQRASFNRLRGLVEVKKAELRGSVARKALTSSPARNLASGKIVMDDIRKSLIELRGHLAQATAEAKNHSADQLKSTSAGLLAFAAGSALLVLMLFMAVENQLALRNRLAEMLRSDNDQLENQVRARTQELSELARHLTHAEETERQRLAHELHDELGAILTAAKMETGWLQRALSERGDSALLTRTERLAKWLSEGIAVKRRIIDDLHPALLESLGLVEALRDLAQDFSRRNSFVIDVELPNTLPTLSGEQSLALYRIAQEALTNIQKHAEAKRAWLALQYANGDTGTVNQLRLRVADDGKGISPLETADARARMKSHGLLGMRHRMDMLGGSLQLAARVGGGTELLAVLPIVAAPAAKLATPSIQRPDERAAA